jgi:hypothetical protein
MLCYDQADSQETGCGVLKKLMIVGISYHSRSFLKTEFDETAEPGNAVAGRCGLRAGR